MMKFNTDSILIFDNTKQQIFSGSINFFTVSILMKTTKFRVDNCSIIAEYLN